MSTLNIYPTQSAQAQAAADLFIACGIESIRERGGFRAALSGGRGPRGLFKNLAGRAASMDWGKVELYWVDERWVPWSDADSNYGEAGRIWLDGWATRPSCFPMYGEGLGLENAARAYEELLVGNFGCKLPVFDLVLLGMGQDGHTASLFPGHASLDETARLCLGVRQPATGQERLTLTLPVLNAARRRVFMLGGGEKAALLAEILAGGRSDLPAARVRRQDTLWLADQDAAALMV